MIGNFKGMPKYFSRMEPLIYSGYNHSDERKYYTIYASIYKRTWYGAKYIKQINTSFWELDEHEEAIQNLSKGAYNEIKDIYKKEAIIVKMLKNNAINNTLEVFAKKLTDLYQ